jgi:hypothetical protein
VTVHVASADLARSVREILGSEHTQLATTCHADDLDDWGFDSTMSLHPMLNQVPPYKDSGAIAFNKFKANALVFTKQSPVFVPSRIAPAMHTLNTRYELLAAMFEMGTSARSLVDSLQEYVLDNYSHLLYLWLINNLESGYYRIIRYLDRDDARQIGVFDAFYAGLKEYRLRELNDDYVQQRINADGESSASDDVDWEAVMVQLETQADTYAKGFMPYDDKLEFTVRLRAPSSLTLRARLSPTGNATNIPSEIISAMQHSFDGVARLKEYPTLPAILFELLTARLGTPSQEERLAFHRLTPARTDSTDQWQQAVESHADALGGLVLKGQILQTFLEGLDVISTGLTERTRNHLAVTYPSGAATLANAAETARRFHEAEVERLTYAHPGRSRIANFRSNLTETVAGLTMQEKETLLRTLSKDQKFCAHHRQFGHSTDECQAYRRVSSQRTMALTEHHHSAPGPSRQDFRQGYGSGRGAPVTCNTCDRRGHHEAQCWVQHPNLAPPHWMGPASPMLRRMWENNRRALQSNPGGPHSQPPPPPTGHSNHKDTALVTEISFTPDLDLLSSAALVSTRRTHAATLTPLVGNVPPSTHAPVSPSRRPLSFTTTGKPAIPSASPLPAIAEEPASAALSLPSLETLQRLTVHVSPLEILQQWQPAQIAMFQQFVESKRIALLSPATTSSHIPVPADAYFSCVRATQLLPAAHTDTVEHDATPTALFSGEALPNCVTGKASLFAFPTSDSAATGLTLRKKGATARIFPKRALFDTAANLSAAPESLIAKAGISYQPHSLVINTSSGGMGTSLGIVPAGALEITLCAGTDQECTISPEIIVMPDSVTHIYDLLIGTTAINKWGAMVDPVRQVLIYRPHLLTHNDSSTLAELPMQVTAALCSQLDADELPAECNATESGWSNSSLFVLATHMQDVLPDPTAPTYQAPGPYRPPDIFPPSSTPPAASPASPPSVDLPMPARLPITTTSPQPATGPPGGGLRMRAHYGYNAPPRRFVTPPTTRVTTPVPDLEPASPAVVDYTSAAAFIAPAGTWGQGWDTQPFSYLGMSSDTPVMGIPAHYPRSSPSPTAEAPQWVRGDLTLPTDTAFSLLAEVEGIWVGDQYVEGLGVVNFSSDSRLLRQHPDQELRVRVWRGPDSAGVDAFTPPASTAATPASVPPAPARPRHEPRAQHFAEVAQGASPSLRQRLRSWQSPSPMPSLRSTSAFSAASGSTDPGDERTPVRLDIVSYLHMLAAAFYLLCMLLLAAVLLLVLIRLYRAPHFPIK